MGSPEIDNACYRFASQLNPLAESGPTFHISSNGGRPSPSQVLADPMTTWCDLLIFNRYANTLRQFPWPNERGPLDGGTEGRRDGQTVGIHYHNRLQNSLAPWSDGRDRRRMDDKKATSAGTLAINLREEREKNRQVRKSQSLRSHGGGRSRRNMSVDRE